MPARVCTSCAVFLAGVASAQPPAPLVTLKGHTDPVYAVAVSPDGTRAATGSFDKTVKLWSLATGRELRTFAGHQSLVLSVAFSPDGGSLASGGSDNAARVWDVPPLQPARETPTGAKGTVLAVSPDGKTVAAGGADGRTRIYAAADMRLVAELGGGTAAVERLAFHPNGAQVFAGGADRTLRGWELPSGKTLGTIEIGTATGLAVAGNGRHVAAATADGKLVVLPLPLPDAKAAKPKAADARGPLAAVPNGPDVLAGGAVWNLGGMSKARTFESVSAATAATITKNGQVAVIAGGPGHAVQFVNVADGRPLASFKAAAAVRTLAAHPNGRLLAGQVADEVVVWNVAFEPNQPVPPEFGGVLQSVPAAAVGLGFALDGSRLVTGTAAGVVRQWKLASDQPKKLDHPNLVDAVAFSPTDANLLATACHDGKVRLFDVAKGTATKTIDAHVTPKPEPVYAVAFSPDGKRLASASYDRSIKIWDAATGNLLRTIEPGRDATTVPANAGAVGGPGAAGLAQKPTSRGHRDQVFCVAFSPDGKRLASGSSDRAVKVWDADTGALVRDFPNPGLKPSSGEPVSHPGFVHAVRFLDGGKVLVSAGTAPRNLGYLIAWDVATGKPLAGGETPVGPVYAVEPTAAGLLIGCGPRVRSEPTAEAHVVRTPGK